MAEKKPEAEAKDEKIRENGHRAEDESGQKMLYRAITEPSEERMPELTDLPLSQIAPLSWMRTYDDVFRGAVKQVEYAVALRKYKNDLRDYEEALVRGDKNAKEPTPPERPERVIPSEIWRYSYYQHRKSLTGAGLKTVAVLAERQLEVQQEMQNEDQLKGLVRD